MYNWFFSIKNILATALIMCALGWSQKPDCSRYWVFVCPIFFLVAIAFQKTVNQIETNLSAEVMILEFEFDSKNLRSIFWHHKCNSRKIHILRTTNNPKFNTAQKHDFKSVNRIFLSSILRSELKLLAQKWGTRDGHIIESNLKIHLIKFF